MSPGAATQLARVRRICLALPETSERLSHGEPTFFAGKRVFAMFSNDHHGDGHLGLWVPAPDGLQEQLVAEDPRVYYRPPYVGCRGWLGIELPRVKDAALRFHVQVAWEMVAPKKAPRATPRGASGGSARTSPRSRPARPASRRGSRGARG